jgi:hypothetical protein
VKKQAEPRAVGEVLLPRDLDEFDIGSVQQDLSSEVLLEGMVDKNLLLESMRVFLMFRTDHF